MNSIRWKETIEVIGMLSIIATLAFVAIEIRQNTNAVRSATIQDISRWSYDSTVALIENSHLFEARFTSCVSDLSEEQYNLMRLWYSALLRIQLNRFYQIHLGIIDKQMALSLGGKGGAYRTPFFAEIWPTLKNEFEPNFQEYIESEILPLSAESC
jgi:hypothetical protein